MEDVLKPVREILSLNTDLLVNCLDGLSEESAVARALPDTNSIGFLVAHLTDARGYLSRLLGHPAPDALQARLANLDSIENAPAPPPLDELRSLWLEVSRHLLDALDSVSGEHLASESGQPFPVPDLSVLGGVSFLTQHDSYHVGQIAMLRKGLGGGAMSYERRSATR